MVPTYEPLVLFEFGGGTATHFPRVYLIVEKVLSGNMLDLVDPRLNFSIF